MGWFPGAIRDPGKNAGYRSGRASMQLAVCHFTVGRDSRALIRDRGLAAFLFPKSGPPIQFCEADATTAHACEWNRLGPGLEVERMGWHEPFTADQSRWVGEVCRWLNATYGIPLVHHPTTSGRLPIGSGFRGFADHGGLVHKACDQHTDGWTDAEWSASVGSHSTGDDMPSTLETIALLSDYVVGLPAQKRPDGQPLSLYDRLSFDDNKRHRELIAKLDELTEAVKGTAKTSWIARLFPAKAERAGTP